MGFRVLRGSTWRLWGAELCNSGFLGHPRILVVFSPLSYRGDWRSETEAAVLLCVL